MVTKRRKSKEEVCCEAFHSLCLEDAALSENDGDGIGTYNEKRFHRIFKRFVTDDASCYEIKIGKYVADVLCDGHITEIQTTAYAKLAPKIRYYLEQTDYTVSVVMPLICERLIIRADRETGEVRYTRRSPQKKGLSDAFANLYYLRELLPDERLMVHVMLVSAEEYRYSERMRYRREGAYDRDVRPVDIREEIVLRGKEAYLRFIPQSLKEREFDAKEFGKATGMSGRGLYSALNTLTDMGLLLRRKQGNKYIYHSA